MIILYVGIEGRHDKTLPEPTGTALDVESEGMQEKEEEEDYRVGEQEGVDSVEDAAMSRNPMSGVLGAVISFDL